MSTPSQDTQRDSVDDNTAASIQSPHREAATEPQTADGSTEQGQTEYQRWIQAWEKVDPKPKIPLAETIKSEKAIESFVWPSAKKERTKRRHMRRVYASKSSLSKAETAATLEGGVMTYEPTSFRSFEP